MSQFKRHTGASVDSDHISLTVSGGTFFSRCLTGLFYMEFVIFVFCYVCLRTSVSRFQAFVCLLQSVGLSMLPS